MIDMLIRAFMKEHRWSCRKLAPKIGISASTLNRVCRSEPMDAKTQLKLINWIFGEPK